jgi:hypothetical protein
MPSPPSSSNDSTSTEGSSTPTEPLARLLSRHSKDSSMRDTTSPGPIPQIPQTLKDNPLLRDLKRDDWAAVQELAGMFDDLGELLDDQIAGMLIAVLRPVMVAQEIKYRALSRRLDKIERKVTKKKR